MSATTTTAAIGVRAETSAASRLVKIGLALGVIGVGATAFGFFKDAETRHQALSGWLVAFAFFTTVSLGGLFFSILHHLVRATWSTPLRRMAENIATNIPLMLVCFVPIVLGRHELYSWMHEEEVAGDPVLMGKAGYLNFNAWIIRAAVYFTIWLVLAFFYRRNSMRQDETGDVALTFRMRKAAPVGTLLFALTLTFAGFDWLMSLDPHWFSTIFGVYIFAGATMSIFATLALSALWLTSRGGLHNSLTVDNLHDVGKLMFGFVVFWTYIAFSQYYLIWYGNIPEETIWYQVRLHHGWETFSRLLAWGHFIGPFWFLMSRHTKRNRVTLGLAAAWLLCMHYLDMYLLVSPTQSIEGPKPSLFDLTALVGIGGLFLAGVAHRLTRDAALPARDPQLAAALEYDNG